jgi:hypothetical protein
MTFSHDDHDAYAGNGVNPDDSSRGLDGDAGRVPPAWRSVEDGVAERLFDDVDEPRRASDFPGDGGSGVGFDDAFSSQERSAEAGSYWQVSKSPLTSLVFTLPLVMAYEGGVLLLGRGSPRNGADVWLRHLLDMLGFGQYFLLPLLMVVGLLAWQHLAGDRWRFSPAVLPGMAAECLLWAVVLIGIARLQQSLWPLAVGGLQVDGLRFDALQFGVPDRGAFARLVGYCGAGLYEEVLFRLLLLPIAVWTLGRLGCGPVASGVWALVLSSALFSAAHYVGPLGDTFSIYSFVFRAVAGMFFAFLFLTRGFGIAAGTHFLYDLLVGMF